MWEGWACAQPSDAHFFALMLAITERRLPMSTSDKLCVLSAEVTWLEEAQGWWSPNDSADTRQVDPASTDSSSTPGKCLLLLRTVWHCSLSDHCSPTALHGQLQGGKSLSACWPAHNEHHVPAGWLAMGTNLPPRPTRDDTSEVSLTYLVYPLLSFIGAESSKQDNTNPLWTQGMHSCSLIQDLDRLATTTANQNKSFCSHWCRYHC